MSGLRVAWATIPWQERMAYVMSAVYVLFCTVFTVWWFF